MSHPDFPKIIAPPPVLYLGVLLLGFALQTISPITLFPSSFWPAALGGLLFVVSGAFARWAFVSMRKLGASANFEKLSDVLVSTGAFRFSRNPIYVAMTGLYLGIALIANSAWPLMLLAPLLLLMRWGVILREERYLSGKFGEGYADYRSKVRRWL